VYCLLCVVFLGGIWDGLVVFVGRVNWVFMDVVINWENCYVVNVVEIKMYNKIVNKQYLEVAVQEA
jgi:hypothetical protein